MSKKQAPGHINIFGIAIFLPLLVSGSIGTYVFELYGGIGIDPGIATADTLEKLDRAPILYTLPGDAPLNITEGHSSQGDIAVNEFWAYWNYHTPYCFLNYCFSAGSVDWEPFYIYVNVATYSIYAVAFRVHYKPVVVFGAPGFNGTIPQFTLGVVAFPGFHTPQPGAPGPTPAPGIGTVPYSNYPVISDPLLQNYNYTQPMDPWVTISQPKTFTNAIVYSGFASAVSFLILWFLFTYVFTLLPFLKKRNI